MDSFVAGWFMISWLINWSLDMDIARGQCYMTAELFFF